MKRIVLLATFFLFSLIPTVQGQQDVVEKGKTVLFDYTLTVDGQVADTSQGKQPLEYIHGNNMIIPGLEKALTGLKEGEKKTVTVPAAEAYGPVNPQAIVEIPRENIDNAQEQTPQPGMVIQLQQPGGQIINGLVTNVTAENLTVDFNHPMAGKDLRFDVKIVEVR